MGLEKLNFDNIILLLTETLYFASVVGVQKAARVFFFFYVAFYYYLVSRCRTCEALVRRIALSDRLQFSANFNW